MTLKSLHYGAAADAGDAMEGLSPVPPPLPRRQPVRNIYAEPFAPDARLGSPAPTLRAPGHAAYSPARFRVDARCRRRCSWRCAACALAAAAALLAAALACVLAAPALGDAPVCRPQHDARVSSAAPPSPSSPPLAATPPSARLSTAGTGGATAAAAAWAPALRLRRLGDSATALVPPYAFWSAEFRNERPAHVALELTLPRGANFAVYGRRNVAPSVTQYDFAEFVVGGRAGGEAGSEARTTNRSLADLSVVRFLDTGRWFLSLYNDELQPQRATLRLTEARDPPACAADCSGRGECRLGVCHCIDGFRGHDCSQSVCPVLCAGHGAYAGGACHCDADWKGAECDVPADDCVPADCGGHGHCVRGRCECVAGWRGERCDTEDCAEPTCGGRGACVGGRCVCRAGWRGSACGERDARVERCLPACSERGVYDLDEGRCICDAPYVGDDCSQVSCALECGPHGACTGGACACAPGWTGERCDQRPCDPRCAQHGQCRNGTCVCSHGWNGKHCTLPGCADACSRHGTCMLRGTTYACACEPDWAGAACAVPLETVCDDNLDNDHDGTADCSDSECCGASACADHIMCLASNDPVEVLLRKPPPALTASFYQRVKFLIEDNSVQSYAHMDEYSESRVAVVRGQVVAPTGQGVVGVRVSVDRDARFGFTLTRTGGWFDVLVNGGGAVTLQFQRSPFRPLRRTELVPWNRIVSLPPVRMRLADDAAPMPLIAPPSPPHPLDRGAERERWSLGGGGACTAHARELLNPRVLETRAPPATHPSHVAATLLYPEQQVVSESVAIPGTGARLVYASWRAAGYLSLARVLLTRATLPARLTRVHVHIDIEGALHTQVYEADPNLVHVFAWNKRNVYNQKVYGRALAKVWVGYEYEGCASVVWEARTATLDGFPADIGELGGWTLDIHHHYNPLEGALRRGDGGLLDFVHYPRAARVAVGTGAARPLACADHCNARARDASLLAPVALAAGADGSLYVGDFNLVRRIAPDGAITTVLQLAATQVSYQYYLCVSPADGLVYVSDPERRQVWRVLALTDVADPERNAEAAVGSGERCVPGDPQHCGDGGPAKAAKLSHPKGIAIAADRSMYIADGTDIRLVEPDGTVRTLVGAQAARAAWSPLPCAGAVAAAAAQLQWPTALALSPLDDSLYLLDDRLVLQLTADGRLEVAAGRPAHCRDSSRAPLAGPLALAFAPDGDLYVAQADAADVHTVEAVRVSGELERVAGAPPPPCACDAPDPPDSPDAPGPCACDPPDPADAETLLASTVRFRAIAALAVGADGTLHVADKGSLHVVSLARYLPHADESGEFRVPYPPTGEVYVFNRYGQHVATQDLVSGGTRYSFLYSKNTSFGKLTAVTDATGGKLQLLRDYAGVPTAIESAHDAKLPLDASLPGLLARVGRLRLHYDAGGLLLAKTLGADTTLYAYDERGRLERATAATGERWLLDSELSDDALQVNVRSEGGAGARCDAPCRYSIARRTLVLRDDTRLTQASAPSDDTLEVRTPAGDRVRAAATARHPLLQAALPVEAELLRVWSDRSVARAARRNDQRDLYSLVGDARAARQTLQREIRVNDSCVLVARFDQASGQLTYLDARLRPLLTIGYSAAGLPLSFAPHAPGAAPLHLSYDRFDRPVGWRWGRDEVSVSRDRRGLAVRVVSTDGALSVDYDEEGRAANVTLASGRTFRYTHDELGGLARIVVPSGANHSFSAQPSFGFVRVTYTPPGGGAYVRHESIDGLPLLTAFPGDGARVLYRYTCGRLAEVVHGDAHTQFEHDASSGLLSAVTHVDRDIEYRCEYARAGALVVEERIEFAARSGLSNAKLLYDYDANWRLVGVQGRIGGQTLAPHRLAYDALTGTPNALGSFSVARPAWNESVVSDGTAAFSRALDERFQPTRVALAIHSVEVFCVELAYDARGRVASARTHTRPAGAGADAYGSLKNYTWDHDGRLAGVEAQEPWRFSYDDGGNLLALAYRGNTIPMQYDERDRIVRFGEGHYRYDARGRVAQNAREERFQYGSDGLLVRATKRGRFDVRYYYDHARRLATRKDNFGNVTQLFYADPTHPVRLTHLYSPRDNRLMALLYDHAGHLIYVQVARHKYYVATDGCGTPLMLFNQYGEGVREMMRSPYGHIVYDSNPYLYLPVDFCGGVLDPATSLVHMPGGGVYDPLIGQWMTPQWERALSAASAPHAPDAGDPPPDLHLYRFNGNDPINYPSRARPPSDEAHWLRLLGYDVRSLAPQLRALAVPPAAHAPPLALRSAFLEYERERRPRLASGPRAPAPAQRAASRPAAADPPLGRGIVLTRTASGRAAVAASPAADPIFRDVYTSVLNGSHVLPFSLPVHGDRQDVFYLVKEEAWRAADDATQLKRLQGKVNVSFHEQSDVRIHAPDAVLNVRYGTTPERERARLLHRARLAAARRAWQRERELLRAGLGSRDWSAAELEEIARAGTAAGYEAEYVRDPARYPELAEDAHNVRLVRRRAERSTRSRLKPST